MKTHQPGVKIDEEETNNEIHVADERHQRSVRMVLEMAEGRPGEEFCFHAQFQQGVERFGCPRVYCSTGVAGSGENGPCWKERRADYRRRLSGNQGVSGRLLDY